MACIPAPECPAYFYFGVADETFSHFAPYLRVVLEMGEDAARARFSTTALFALAAKLSRLMEEQQRHGNLKAADRAMGLAFYFLRRQTRLSEELGDAKGVEHGRKVLYKLWEKEVHLAADKNETGRASDALRALAGIEREENRPLSKRTYSILLGTRLRDAPDGHDFTRIMAVLRQGARVKGPAAKDEDRKSRCGVCGVAAGKNDHMRCSRCHSIWYCSRKCQ